MKTERFTIGDTFTTSEGTATITGYNGHLAYIDLETVDYPEGEDGTLDYDQEIIVHDQRRWTLEEIAHELRAVDGHNHKVFVEPKKEDNSMTIYDRPITQEDMTDISSYMDDEIREELHAELAPCDPETFIRAYLERDPGFLELLQNEFDFRA